MNDNKLTDALGRFNRQTYLTVIFIDSDYWDIFKNWHDYASKYLAENLLVVSLDEHVAELLVELDVATFLLAWDGDTGKLWIERVKILRSLVEQGYSIIHSDVDAVWLGNVVSYCEAIDSDVGFSQGTIWPPDTYHKLKLVLCCGFFFIRNNAISLGFLREWEQAVQADGDDQRALNNLMVEKNLAWPVPADYMLSWQGREFKCFNEVQVSTLSNDLKVALLPHALFQRVIEKKPALLKHPLSEKNGLSSQTILKLNNCWSLT